jgi:dimethylglycine dehydrogenase
VIGGADGGAVLQRRRRDVGVRGNYGFRLEKIRYAPPDHSQIGSELEMTILDRRHPVTVIPESPYDPENARLRS